MASKAPTEQKRRSLRPHQLSEKAQRVEWQRMIGIVDAGDAAAARRYQSALKSLCRQPSLHTPPGGHGNGVGRDDVECRSHASPRQGVRVVAKYLASRSRAERRKKAGANRWWDATIAAVHEDGTFDVAYFDGVREARVRPEFVVGGGDAVVDSGPAATEEEAEEGADEGAEEPAKGRAGPRSRLRMLHGLEGMAGTCRLAKALARSGCDMIAVERDPRAPEYDTEVLPGPHASCENTSRAPVRLQLCDLRDIQPSSLPTLDFASFSPHCASVSMAAGKSHPRTELNGYLGTTPTCKAYNADLSHIVHIIMDQRNRPGNARFRFVIEAPFGNAMHVPILKNIVEMPTEHGGLGATRVMLDHCKFGVVWRKRTFLWTNVETLVAQLSGDSHAYLCTAANPCAHFGAHAHICRDVSTKEATPFPHDLAVFLQQQICGCCAPRRHEV